MMFEADLSTWQQFQMNATFVKSKKTIECYLREFREFKFYSFFARVARKLQALVEI